MAGAWLSALLLSVALAALLGLATAAPVHATTQTFAAAKDTWVWSGVPDNNIGSTTTAEVGRTVSKSGTVVLKRGLLHFDLAALPADAALTTATLRLFIERTSADPLNLALTVRRLQSGFVEGDGTTGVTWNTQPGVEPTPTGTGTMNTLVGAWFEMNVTAVVLAARGSPDPNNIWLRVAPTDETTIELRDFAFRTKEYGTGAHAAELVLDYELPTVTPTSTPVPPPTSTATSTPTVTPTDTPPGPTLPPDPSTIAPEVDRSVATDFYDATTFLYTAPTPIQGGVAAGTIEARRAAVIRGQVRTRAGAPLPGITVSILDHPEFGSTLTRADGRFDLVVNGGGSLTVDYTDQVNDGVDYLRVHRQVAVPWNEYVWAPDVVMIPADVATVIDFAAPAGIQVARGSAVTDTDGTRQATVLFNPTTTAVLVRADGSTVPVTNSLSVRATEYTVGASGPEAMPAALPPTSGYTYAVELSADEVAAAGAEQVVFSEPVWFYLENFLNFPVGSAVPTGYYDRRAGEWVPSDNGRVLAVMSEDAQGYAQLDTDGDGEVDNDASGILGITAAERQRLGALYDPGATLWRVPITHFTPWDHNWPYGPPEDAEEPDSEVEEEEEEDDPCTVEGSILDCETQTLRERIPLAGTPFALHYSSTRQLGRLAARTRRIRLSGPSVPPSLKRIELEISVLGQVIRQTFSNAPNQVTSFTWDGRDVYGRLVEGEHVLRIGVGYVYDAVYFPLFADFVRAFARFPPATPFRGIPTRKEYTILKRFTRDVQASDSRAAELGGWSLDAHHLLDPAAGTLWLGTGERHRSTAVPRILTGRIGGGNSQEEGVRASEAEVRYPQSLAAGSDGSVYIGEYDTEFNPGGGGFGLARVRRVGPEGTITTVAGNLAGGIGYAGDGGPATAALLSNVADIDIGPDGSLYIADTARVRRVAPDGIITTFAGNGTYGDGGDGGPATAAQIWSTAVAAAPDGSVYIGSRIETDSDRVRRVRPDGIIETIAGGGTSTADGVPATQAYIGSVSGLAVAADGSVIVSDSDGHQVRRIGTDGIVRTIAGTGVAGYGGDGGLAVNALLNSPLDLVIARDGSLYIADVGNNRIRRRGPAGVITTVAGGGSLYAGLSPDDAPAMGADLGFPKAVALAPTDSVYGVYVAQSDYWRVTRVGHPLQAARFIPSPDGSEIYEFDPDGRHLFTRHALTGAVRYAFGYDNGRLVSVTDGDGNQTSLIISGTSGTIRGPYLYQETQLALDGNGYLLSVTNPKGETVQLAHSSAGLLERLIDARNNAWEFTYDADGRLRRDDDPAAGYQTLARTPIANGYQVTRRTAEGRDTVYAVERPPAGGQVRRVTAPDGTVTETVLAPDARREQTLPDQTVRTIAEGPDPRFGTQAPVPEFSQEGTPGGLLRTVTATREVTLADPFDLLSLEEQRDTTVVNGKPFETVYTAGNPSTLTSTSPLLRQTVAEIDAQARVRKRTAAGLHPVRYAYDARGRLTTITHGPDPDPTGAARVTTFTYKDTTDVQNGSLDTVTDTENRPVQFTYDGAGRVLTQTFLPSTPDERVIGYGYDPNGNLTSVTPPGRPAHGFDYTAVNLEQAYTPPAVPLVPAPQTTYGYDLDQDLTSIVRPDGRSVLFGYEPGSGRLGTVILEPEGEARAYTYHPTSGHTASVSSPHALLSFGYDGSLLTTETWAFVDPAVSHTVTHGYDTDFRRASLQINALPLVAFGYDDDGLLTQAGALTLARDPSNGLLTATTVSGGVSSVTDATGYSLFGELATYTAAVNGTPLFDLQVTARDQLGRITATTETIEGGGGVATHYRYDPAGRLWQVCADAACATVRAEYLYDANGNRLSRTTSAGTVSGTYDNQDRLETYGATTYMYTANGELASKTDASGTATYTYDALGNLRAVVLDDGGPNEKTIEYLVDGRNRRIGKVVNGVFQQGFLYKDQIEPVAELGPSGAVVAAFVYGAKPHVPDYLIRYDEQTGQPTGTYRIISDQLGSPRLVIDLADGAVVQRLDYDEFGTMLVETTPGFQPFGFAGGLYDRDTKLVRFGARDYHAETGRWTAKDAISFRAGDANLFGYVAADPVNAIDPSGLQVWSPERALLAAIASGNSAEILTRLEAVGLNPNLSNAVQALFQLSDRIPGGTAGALRDAVARGAADPGHFIKAVQRATQLTNLVAKGLCGTDRAVANALLQDLQAAIVLYQGSGLPTTP